MKQNTGLDTETYQGYVKLICDDKGNFKDIENFDDVIDFLTKSRYRNKYNWFYNIQYDFESIIKLLNYDQLLALYHEKILEINPKWSIKYIPKKFFAIIGKHKDYYYFYDLYNFLDTSLNKAAKKFLGDEKLDNVDVSRLNVDLDYWKENYVDIRKYCIKDAYLTKQLADYFWGLVYQKLNFYPKSPMSKGKLSEEYFLHKCIIPSIAFIPDKAIETAYNSYYGGHFEILKRGYFDKVYSYDIKSAYPAEIANLPDYTKGKWYKVYEVCKEARSGFYKCRIESMELPFSPFMQKIGGQAGLNVYPNGRFIQYLTKQEIEFFREYFPNSAIKIDFGWEFYETKEVKPFFDEITRLYAWKEVEKDPDIRYCVKIIMNSLYGKLIQVSGDGNYTGKLFNPAYAAEVTAGARIKILKLALQKPFNIISFSTDSVSSTTPLNVCSNPNLGDFEKDFTGEGVVIMSDVYNYWNNELHKEKSKLRGFSLASSKEIDSSEVYLKDILAKMDKTTIYKYIAKRPYHLGECLSHRKKRSVKDINIFGEVEKSIDVNGDTKRVWENSFKSGKECLECNHISLPLTLGVK